MADSSQHGFRACWTLIIIIVLYVVEGNARTQSCSCHSPIFFAQFWLQFSVSKGTCIAIDNVHNVGKRLKSAKNTSL